VRKDATISLQGNRYQVPSHLVGRTLELRFGPFDLAEMGLYLDGKSLGRATVLFQGRARHLAVRGLDSELSVSAKAKPQIDFLAALRAEQLSASQQALGRLSFASLLPGPKPPAPDKLEV